MVPDRPRTRCVFLVRPDLAAIVAGIAANGLGRDCYGGAGGALRRRRGLQNGLPLAALAAAHRHRLSPSGPAFGPALWTNSLRIDLLAAPRDHRLRLAAFMDGEYLDQGMPDGRG